MAGIRLRVHAVTAETPSIRTLVFSPVDGDLPGWEVGSHIRLDLPGGGSRPYSLVALPDLDPAHWALGVLLEDKSSGGSKFMHALSPGDVVTASAPSNNFPLHGDDAPAVLFAGGIGVTPILSMAAALQARGAVFRVHYTGRTASRLAFVRQLRAICGPALRLHSDDDETRLDIPAALAEVPPEAHVYVCGPAGMIDAVKAAATAKGIAAARIHFELFKAEVEAAADTPFEVELASTGDIVLVPANQTIIEALEAAGHEPLYDCRRGDCGICQCSVIDGIPDHRDVILSDEEKASNTVMQICVSRAKTPRLVLDL